MKIDGPMLLLPAGAAGAQGSVKIGVVAEFSGPFADYGAQILGGMKAYLKQNGDVFGGKKIEIVTRDTTGAAPDIAKRLAQELVTRDQVDILAGFGLTPNALAVAPVSAEAKKPMVIMNAATSVITTRSPYIVRVSHTLPQDTQPIAQWAASGVKRASRWSPTSAGVDAERHSSSLQARVGEIVDSVRTPLQNGLRALPAAGDAKLKRCSCFSAGEQTMFIKRATRARPQAGRHQDHCHRRSYRRRVLQAMGEPTSD
jgi:branched-chain amino acid transport system substrate-binding protein